MANEKTFSEQLFEKYLVSQGMMPFDYEKDWEVMPAHPLLDVFEIPNGNFC
jgi:hypothetical protein